MSPVAALAVAGLGKSFGGFQAVKNVSFSVSPGEIVALIGPNGAGKTTTFNLINGQLRPDCGRIRMGDDDVTGLETRSLARSGLARTFQITATFPSMTVGENIALARMANGGGPWLGLGRLRRMPTLDDPESNRLIANVGLEALADRVCATLAYGDLKRVELAMALANAPRLLLMDEPTAGMAAAQREALMALAIRIAHERGSTILFTEHDMGIVFRHAERVLVMSRGEIIASGTPQAIRENPLVREIYLGRANMVRQP